MHDQKSKHAHEREALMALAADDALWQCGRGHAWDDRVSAAQNVRCMNCATQRREQHTERLNALAQERGGRLISAAYADAATPVHWECVFGHSWDASPDEVTRRGCGECTRRGVYDPAHALKTLP